MWRDAMKPETFVDFFEKVEDAVGKGTLMESSVKEKDLICTMLIDLDRWSILSRRILDKKTYLSKEYTQ